MKNIWLKSFLAVAVLATVQTVARAEGENIGFIDLDRVFNEYSKTKIADAQLKEQAEEFKTEHKAMVEDLQKLQDEFNALRDDAQNTALSEDAQNDKRMAAEEKLVEVREKESSIRRYDESRQKQLDEQSRRMRKKIVEEIQDVVSKFSETQSFSVVIDSSGDSLNGVPVVLYADPKHDITDEVLEQLNKNSSGADLGLDAKDETPSEETKPAAGE